MIFTYKLKPGLWFGRNWSHKSRSDIERGDILQGVLSHFSDFPTVVEDKPYYSVSVIFECHGQALWDNGDEFLSMTQLTCVT